MSFDSLFIEIWNLNQSEEFQMPGMQETDWKSLEQ
jgi:hypothetical protein